MLLTVVYLSIVGFACGRNLDRRAQSPARMFMDANNIPSSVSDPENANQFDRTFSNLTAPPETKPVPECDGRGPPVISCLDALSKVPKDRSYIVIGTRNTGLPPHGVFLPWYIYVTALLSFSCDFSLRSLYSLVPVVQQCLTLFRGLA